MTITLGWWVIPFIVTLGTLIWAMTPERSPTFESSLVGAVQLMGMVSVCLALWLIWSLFA